MSLESKAWLQFPSQCQHQTPGSPENEYGEDYDGTRNKSKSIKINICFSVPEIRFPHSQEFHQ